MRYLRKCLGIFLDLCLSVNVVCIDLFWFILTSIFHTTQTKKMHFDLNIRILSTDRLYIIFPHRFYYILVYEDEASYEHFKIVNYNHNYIIKKYPTLDPG